MSTERSAIISAGVVAVGLAVVGTAVVIKRRKDGADADIAESIVAEAEALAEDVTA